MYISTEVSKLSASSIFVKQTHTKKPQTRCIGTQAWPPHLCIVNGWFHTTKAMFNLAHKAESRKGLTEKVY